MGWEQHTRAVARRAGLGRVRRRVKEAFPSREVRRDRQDRHHLRLILAFALAEDANCIDVGANVGSVLRDIVRYAPKGHHIAYEPLTDLAERIAHEFPDVDVRAAAASNRAGEATIHRVKARPSRSSLDPLNYPDRELEPTVVKLEDIDSHLPPGYAPALIKIDVEGAEAQVLEGAQATLRRFRPIVVVEHDYKATEHFGARSRDVHRLLTDPGLRLFDIDGNGPLDANAFEARVRAGVVWNWVARP